MEFAGQGFGHLAASRVTGAAEEDARLLCGGHGGRIYVSGTQGGVTIRDRHCRGRQPLTARLRKLGPPSHPAVIPNRPAEIDIRPAGDDVVFAAGKDCRAAAWKISRTKFPSPQGRWVSISSTSIKAPRLSVSEKNLQTAAARLLPKTMKLVSAEVEYLRRTLGKTATQSDIDANVLAVRKLPWASIYAGD